MPPPPPPDTLVKRQLQAERITTPIPTRLVRQVPCARLVKPGPRGLDRRDRVRGSAGDTGPVSSTRVTMPEEAAGDSLGLLFVRL